MPHSSGGIETHGTPFVPNNYPESSDQDSAGSLGSRSVSKTPGHSIVRRSDEDTSSTSSSSDGGVRIHDRKAEAVLEKRDAPLPEHEETDSQMESSSNRSHDTDDAASDITSDTPSIESDSPSDSSPAEIDDSPTAEEAVGASVTVDRAGGKSIDERKQKFQEELQPKLGFLDKYAKETGVSIGGAAMVMLGAGLFAVFPPAGLFIYSAGVVLMSMGISKMLFALDESMPPPSPSPDKPGKENDKPESKKTEDGSDDDYFKAISKPVLDALAGKDAESEPITPDLSERAEHQKRSASPTEAAKTAPASGVNPADLLAEIQDGVASGKKPSEAFAEALATILAANKEIDPDDESVYEALVPALNFMETVLDDENEASGNDRSQSSGALDVLKVSLSRASSELLSKLSTATETVLNGSSLFNAARGVAASMANLIHEVEAGLRPASSGSSSPGYSGSSLSSPPPPPPPSPDGVAEEMVERRSLSSDLSDDSSSLSSSTSAGSSFGAYASQQNKVRFSTFTIELDNFFNNPDARGDFTEADKAEILEKAMSVANRENVAGEDSFPLGATLSQRQFYEELEGRISERLKPVVRQLNPLSDSGSNRF